MEFVHYRLKETEHGYEIYLYVDPNDSEFARELGDRPDEMKEDLKERVHQFIKKRMRGVRIVTANIMIGTTLLMAVPLQDVSAHDASFNMSYLYFGSTQQNIQSVEQTNGNLDVIAPSYFDLNTDGSLAITSKFDKTFVDEMHKRGIRVVPFVSNHWDREVGRAALENRELLSDQIANFIIENQLDGVNVDIENVTDADRDHYTDFVRLLREKLPVDKEISVAVAANPNQWTKGWHGSYDNEELAKYADYLMVMAYDEHFQGGDPGPVASISWVEKTIQTMINGDNVPSEKIVLGLPFFGRYWNDAESTGGYGASNTQVEMLISKYNGAVTFDEQSQSPKATFTIKASDPATTIAGRTLKPGNYEVWYENNESIHAKIDLVHKYNLKGTGSWSLGQENTSVWNNYGMWLSDHEHTPDNSPDVQTADQTKDLLPFKDTRTHWAHDEILYTYQKDWFQGRTDTTFAPNDGLTRAQAAALFVKIFDLKPIEPLGNTATFTDVGTDYWAWEVIEIVQQHGVFKGRLDGTFQPRSELTREQMAAVLDNVLSDVYDPAKANEHVSFRDVSEDNGFYNAIVNMKQQGIFEGSQDGTFRPGDSVTRAQMAVVLTNSADKIHEVKGDSLFNQNLRSGNQGADVTLLQIYLKRIGFLGNVTSTFNQETEDAVRTFQQKYGLSVDGISGPVTANKLLDVLK